MSDIDTTLSRMYNRVINFQSIVRLFAKDLSPFAFFLLTHLRTKDIMKVSTINSYCL